MQELIFQIIIGVSVGIIANLIAYFIIRAFKDIQRQIKIIVIIIIFIISFIIGFQWIAHIYFTARISIRRAIIDTIGEVGPGNCTFEYPCTNLQRGSVLHLEIKPKGYAVAYLQDAHGIYCNQEGRLLIKNEEVGDIRLWPGTPRRIEDSIFKLFIVLSSKKIITYGDSEGLEKLPKGKKWGPVYLKVGSHNSSNTLKNQNSTLILSDTNPITPEQLDNGDYSITINHPDRYEYRVECEMDVKGIANIPSGSHIWLLVHRTKGFKEVWWPQKEAKFTQGKWQGHVVFGGRQDIGYEFEMAAILVNQENHIQLEDYRRTALRTGDWLPIDMPSTLIPPTIRKVIKVGHGSCK